MLSREQFAYSSKKARNKHSLKLNPVIKYVAVLAVSVAAFQSSDVPAEVRPAKGGPREYTETVTSKSGEKISFGMVLVPGGTFVMGSPEGEPGRKDDEGPQHEMRVAPFYICPTETTIELFLAYYEEMMSAKRQDAAAGQDTNDLDAITGPTPVYGDLTMGYGKKHPAIGMTWHNAMTFCEWLSRKTGRKYRLPTEAEWECACRAGPVRSSLMSNSSDRKDKISNGAGATNVFAPDRNIRGDPNQLNDYVWYKADSEGEPHEVARKKPNAWGLYDMLGNVREWVYDFYSPTAYTEIAKKSPTRLGEGPSRSRAVNPTGPKSGEVHVARGGAYDSSIEELRCAARAFEEKWWRMNDPQIPKSKWWFPQMDFIGFRIAISIDPNDKSMGNQNNRKD